MDQMLSSLSAKQFIEWEAYAALEPFDEYRQDIRVAQIVTMLANLHRDPKRAPYSIKEFVLDFEQPDPKTPEELEREREAKVQSQIAIFRAMVQAYNAPGINS